MFYKKVQKTIQCKFVHDKPQMHLKKHFPLSWYYHKDPLGKEETVLFKNLN